MYTKKNLIRRSEAGYKDEYLFFFGHHPERDGSIGTGCLSQWWEATFVAPGGVKYISAEQYMMAEKARLFEDETTRAKILQCTSPKEAKALGRRVQGFDETVWGAACFNIVVLGNLAKFSQNANLRSYLLSTAPRVLVEASPYDKIWGIGLRSGHAHTALPALWPGQNLLGFALMTVRDLLSRYDGVSDRGQ